MYKKNKYPLLKDLTIVINTYNRKKFIMRALNYWSNFNVNILVLDGSELSIEDKFIKNFSDNIRYIHHPSTVRDRMLRGLNFIQTEFVLLGSDDEYFIPSALNSCIKTLNENDELVACIGRAMKFSYKNDQTIGRRVYAELKNHKLLHENPEDRIKDHFKNYIPRHCYSVCRSVFWKLAWQETYTDKELNFFAAPEYIFEFLITFANKSIAIPELMWLRSDENKAIRGKSPSSTLGYGIADWWYDKSSEKEVEKKRYINQIENACKKINKINNKNYNPNIIEGTTILANYFKYEHPKLFKKGFFSYPLNQLYYIFKRFPDRVKNLIFAIWRVFKIKIHKINQLPFFEQLKMLEKEGVKIDYEELIYIEKEIKKFYLK